jgi:hypothetical protein
MEHRGNVMTPIEDLFESDLEFAEKKLGKKLSVFLLDGNKSEFPKKRDMAYTQFDRKGVPIKIVINPALRHKNPYVQLGVLRHEIAHAIMMIDGDLEHSEIEADIYAEEIYGTRIWYNTDKIQTILPDRHAERPSDLPK